MWSVVRVCVCACARVYACVNSWSRAHLDVALVDERVDQLERALPDGRVVVLQAVDDGVAVALHGLRVGASIVSV